VTGLSASLETDVELALPAEVSLVSGGPARVTVAIEPETGSRSWQVGVRLKGARGDREYALSASTVLVTLGGPVAVLASLDPGTIVAPVEVAKLGIGNHEVDVKVVPIDGLETLDVAPDSVEVRVTRSSARPSASAAPEGSTRPGASPDPLATEAGS
jgi:YbbR domain-containing protein